MVMAVIEYVRQALRLCRIFTVSGEADGGCSATETHTWVQNIKRGALPKAKSSIRLQSLRGRLSNSFTSDWAACGLGASFFTYLPFSSPA